MEITKCLNGLKDHLSSLASVCHETKYFDLKNKIIMYDIRLKQFKEKNESLQNHIPHNNNNNNTTTPNHQSPNTNTTNTVDIRVNRRLEREEQQNTHSTHSEIDYNFANMSNNNHNKHHPIKTTMSPIERQRNTRTIPLVKKQSKPQYTCSSITPLRIQREPSIGDDDDDDNDNEESISESDHDNHIVDYFDDREFRFNSGNGGGRHYKIGGGQQQLNNGGVHRLNNKKRHKKSGASIVYSESPAPIVYRLPLPPTSVVQTSDKSTATIHDCATQTETVYAALEQSPLDLGSKYTYILDQNSFFFLYFLIKLLY